MSEPTVKVPVSLIEDALEFIQARATLGIPPVARNLRALLSQPTPTAEEIEREAADVQFENMYPDDPEPPRIEDLAPGTTFDGDAGRGMERWTRQIDGVTDRHGNVWGAHEVDPSTIRDVREP